MIGSAVGLVGLGVFGLARVGRIAPPAPGAEPGGFDAAASAFAVARRVVPEPPPLAFPVDPTGGLIVLNNFGADSVSLGDCAHRGIDIFPTSGGPGRPLLACVDATLRDWRLAPGSGAQGNAWILEDEHGDIYRYHHLDGFAEGLEPGMTVQRGDLIGFMGSTGNTGAAHLHFEVRRGGTAGPAVDPVPLLPFPIPEVELTEPMGCSSP